jgi:hypothetical protein
MAIAQLVNAQLNLQADGVSTSYTFSPNRLFEFINQDGGTIGNIFTPATSVTVQNVPADWVLPTGSVDAYGNITLTFSVAPPAEQGLVYLGLYFAGGSTTSGAATWTSATTANTALTITTLGQAAVELSLNITGSLTAGLFNFEVSDDGSHWYSIPGIVQSTFAIFTNWQPSFGSASLQFATGGYAQFRVRVATILTGTGNVLIQAQTSSQPVDVLQVAIQQFGPNLHIVLDDAAGGNAVNTTTQGVQASRALMTQDFKDSGRTQLTFYVDQLTGVTSEALASMQSTKALVAQSAATNYTVSAGQTLRIKTITLTVKNTTTTLASSRIRVRAVASGTVTATSPIIFTLDCPGMTGTQAANVGNTIVVPIPDGLELPSGANFGFSHIESTTSSNISVCIEAFEY